MWQAKAENRVLPSVIEIMRGDTEEERILKQLILDMTKYNPYDRHTMDDVEQQLVDVQS